MAELPDDIVEQVRDELGMVLSVGSVRVLRAVYPLIAAHVRAEAVADERQRIAAAIEAEAHRAADAPATPAWPEAFQAGRVNGLVDAKNIAAGSVPVATPDEKADALLGKHCAYISRTVTASYPAGMDPELVMRRRVGKIFVEAGELGDAIEGWTGENPRKGVYATREDVIKELIDCASASLCAIEYMTGDLGLSVGIVARQVIGNAQRLSESIPDRCEPAVSPVATPTEPPHVDLLAILHEDDCEHGNMPEVCARCDEDSPVLAVQPVDEVACPSCGTTIRARMSDTQSDEQPEER